MQIVTFNYLDSALPLKNKTMVKAFIPTIFKKEKKGLNYINYIFCSDESLLELNKQQLNHDYYTDILTFELSSTDKTEAEIYISVDRIKDNAKVLKQPLEKEILRVLFHGALHLCGYKDKTKKEEDIMREKEEYYINNYYKRFVPRETLNK
ncbi:rRNA maturation RNase YbeY [Arachidicoccus ginsenosidivorans]|jgi:rRNA maturation RNase YbeY|uniref:Endoribonuclease YbeY n=1 Tax=Arachidicoccus ginsenosidivorans TaxID=496057 RepID=A0A5B8VLC2_9BACT|nr:rRNA maturation RNase YbeY [Arachidicoccus ginsenosidivorans]QEC71762.1 rRNA maturation RNase YbeY [Arachidicoccus ginsenosidivorans]